MPCSELASCTVTTWRIHPETFTIAHEESCGKDKNYDEGTRAIMEAMTRLFLRMSCGNSIGKAIYEPSQESSPQCKQRCAVAQRLLRMVGEIAEPLTDDQEMSRVNRQVPTVPR